MHNICFQGEVGPSGPAGLTGQRGPAVSIWHMHAIASFQKNSYITWQ